MRTPPCAWAIPLAFAAIAAGCGGGRDALEKQLSEIRAELVRVRADGAVTAARLDALERAGRPRGDAAPAPPDRAAGAASSSSSSDRPDLDVVRLVPARAEPPPPAGPEVASAAAPDAPADGAAARPVLRSSGADVILDESPRAPQPKAPPAPGRRKP